MYLWSVLAIHSMPISVLLNHYVLLCSCDFSRRGIWEELQMHTKVEAIWSYNRTSHVSVSQAFLTVSNKITEPYRTTKAFSLSMQRLECSILRKGQIALT